MNHLKLSEIVRRKIAAVKGLQETSVSAESSIKDDLGISSMEYITILTDVAVVLGIDLMKFSERDILSAHTVGDLERVIASKLPIQEKNMLDFNSDIVLEGWGVVLRPWVEQDVGKIVESATDPLIWKYTTEALSNKDDVRKYVSRAIADREAGKRYSFAICLKDSGAIVGSSSFGNLSAKDRRVEIGWTWLAPEYHGKGLNNVVKYLMLKYYFEELDAHRIEFKTDNANPRSCGALEKIGAKRDGVLRSHTLMHDGRYRDTVYYSLLNEEWAQVSSALGQRITSGKHEYRVGY
ncbi:MAG: GNAT family N-acetyltransferase [Sideroxyarcus sp.]|nr:GNAT family N-acetyltransferase [Sideroxyarcus sp.]